jgi:hypothetical protein
MAWTVDVRAAEDARVLVWRARARSEPSMKCAAGSKKEAEEATATARRRRPWWWPDDSKGPGSRTPRTPQAKQERRSSQSVSSRRAFLLCAFLLCDMAGSEALLSSQINGGGCLAPPTPAERPGDVMAKTLNAFFGGDNRTTYVSLGPRSIEKRTLNCAAQFPSAACQTSSCTTRARAQTHTHTHTQNTITCYARVIMAR